MVTVDKRLFSRLGGIADAVVLDTPYAFQQNATDVSARAVAYFAKNVGVEVRVQREANGGGKSSRAALCVRSADWVFSGAIRDALAAAGIEVRDDRTGTSWATPTGRAVGPSGPVSLPSQARTRTGSWPSKAVRRAGPRTAATPPRAVAIC